MKKIGTHNGLAHADDVMATAILMMALGPCEVIRTRDQALLDTCDILVDVGGVFDPSRDRFDHHQRGGAGTRPGEKGIAYASAGLVWSKYGHMAVEAAGVPPGDVAAVVAALDDGVISQVDAVDNGIGDRRDSAVSSVVSMLMPSWPNDNEEAYSDAFHRAVEMVRAILDAQISAAAGRVLAERMIATVSWRLGPILVLDEAMPYSGLTNGDPSILFVVHPHRDGKSAVCMTVPVEKGSFTARKDLPASWAGLTGSELAQVTGVKDAVFCHNKRFIGVAGSFEGALEMARIAAEY